MLVCSIQPATPHGPCHGIADHTGDREFLIGTRDIEHLPKHPGRQLALPQGCEVAYVYVQERGMIRMVSGQKAQGFAKTQQGKAIAPAPIVRGRATVPEQTIGLLRAGAQEETRQQIEIAPLARESEGATKHRTVHEHVFGAESGSEGGGAPPSTPGR